MVLGAQCTAAEERPCRKRRRKDLFWSLLMINNVITIDRCVISNRLILVSWRGLVYFSPERKRTPNWITALSSQEHNRQSTNNHKQEDLKKENDNKSNYVEGNSEMKHQKLHTSCSCASLCVSPTLFPFVACDHFFVHTLDKQWHQYSHYITHTHTIRKWICHCCKQKCN